MPNLLKDLVITEVSFVPAGANQGARIMLYKAAVKQVADKFEGAKPSVLSKGDNCMDLEQALAKIAELEKELEALKKSATLVATDPADELPPELKKHVQLVEDENVKLRKEFEALQAQIVEKQLREELSKHAEVLPGKVDEALPLFKSAAEPVRAFVLTVLAKAAAQLKQAEILKQQLGDDTGQDNTESALTRWNTEVEKVAKELNLNKAAAAVHVMGTSPDLYRQYRAEKK